MPDIAPLERRLSALRRRVRLGFLGGILARLATVAVLAVSAAVGADWVVHAERPVRLVFLALAAGGVLAAVRRLWAPLLAPMTDEDLALAVEAANPGLKDRLISALQLARSRPNPFNSPVLVARTLEDAVAASERVDFGASIVCPRRGRWIAYALGACAVFGALTALSADFRVGLIRLVGDRAWPSAYALDVEVGATRIGQGDDLPVTARSLPGKRIPRRVVLHVQQGSGDPAELTMAPQEGAWRHVLEGLTKDVTVWVTASDFESVKVSVRVLEKPVVTAFTLGLTPPDYTGLPVATLPAGSGHLRALRGTRVHVAGTASKALKGAALKFAKRVLPLQVSGEAGFSGDFVIEEDDSYVFTLEDHEDVKAAHPVSYQVTVLKDQAPAVRILKPAKEMEVLATAKIHIAVDAQDDYGLGAGSLVTVSNRGTPQEKETRLSLFEAPAAKDVKVRKAELVWDLAPLKLEVGRQLRYHAEAKDLDTVSGPNLGRSQEWGLRIVSPDEKENEVQRRLDEMVSDLMRAKEAARRVRTDMEAQAGAPKDPARESKAAALALDEGRVRESVDQIRDALSALRNDLSMNGMGDSRRDEMLQGAEEALKAVAQERIPQVADQAKAGAKGEAGAWDKALKGQEDVIKELERQAGQLQGAANLGQLLQRLEKLIEENDRLIHRTARAGGAAPGENK